MSGKRLSINEDFLKYYSKELCYVLGVLHHSLRYEGDYAIITNRSRDLIEILKQKLESEHKIVSINDPKRDRNSHFIEIRLSEYARESLVDFGLGVDKSKREVPRFNDSEDLEHFTRGFYDACGSVGLGKQFGGNGQRVYFRFKKIFLEGFDEVLKSAIGTKKGSFWGAQRNLVYDSDDTKKIRDFMYGDFEFIKEKGIYLPGKRELLLQTLSPARYAGHCLEEGKTEVAATG